MQELTWKVEYDNDTGPFDEAFCEWWTVTNEQSSFRCDSERDAEWLCKTLNKQP